MTEETPSIGHNAPETVRLVREYVTRIERINDEISGLQADRSEIFKEAKARGLNPKILRKVVSRRKVDSSTREEEDFLLDKYESILD